MGRNQNTDLAVMLLSEIGQGVLSGLQERGLRNRQNDLIEQDRKNKRQLETAKFIQERMLKNRDAARQILTSALKQAETQKSAVEGLNKKFGLNLEIENIEEPDVGAQILDIANNTELSADERRHQLFQLAANTKGLTFSDVQKFVDSQAESNLLGEQIRSQQALTGQRKASRNLTNKRIQKLQTEVLGNKKLEDMTIEELQNSARKVSGIMNSLMIRDDFGSSVLEGAEDAFNVYLKLQNDIAGELEKRRGGDPDDGGGQEVSSNPVTSKAQVRANLRRLGLNVPEPTNEADQKIIEFLKSKNLPATPANIAEVRRQLNAR